jgi:hypothetical protein
MARNFLQWQTRQAKSVSNPFRLDNQATPAAQPPTAPQTQPAPAEDLVPQDPPSRGVKRKL